MPWSNDLLGGKSQCLLPLKIPHTLVMLGCLHSSLCLSFRSCLSSIFSWGLIIQQPPYLTLLYIFTLFPIFTFCSSKHFSQRHNLWHTIYCTYLFSISTYMLHKAWFLHILFTSVSPALITVPAKLQTFKKYFFNRWMNDAMFVQCSISSRLK